MWWIKRKITSERFVTAVEINSFIRDIKYFLDFINSLSVQKIEVLLAFFDHGKYLNSPGTLSVLFAIPNLSFTQIFYSFFKTLVGKAVCVELKNDLSKIESNYKTLNGKTNKDIWNDELDEFLGEYKNYLDDYYKYMGFDKNNFKVHKPKKLNVRKK